MNWIKKAGIVGVVFLLSVGCNKITVKDNQTPQPQKQEAIQNQTVAFTTATSTAALPTQQTTPTATTSAYTKSKLTSEQVAQLRKQYGLDGNSQSATTTPENFYGQLAALYDEKIQFLDDRIKWWKLDKMAVDMSAEQDKQGLSVFQAGQANGGYYDPYAVQTYQLELDEDSKISAIWQTRVSQGNQIEKKLNDDLFASPNNITQAEFISVQGSLNKLVDETQIQKDDSTIGQYGYFTVDKRKEIDNIIASRAQNAITQADQNLANFQAQQKALPPIPATVPIATGLVCNASANTYGGTTMDCYFTH